MNTTLPTPKLETNEQKVSYGFGLQFGEQIVRNKFDGLDLDAIILGINDIINNQEPKLTDRELNSAFSIVQEGIEKSLKEKAAKMVMLAKTFLEENAKRDGVKVTPSGMQYEILEVGTGEIPTKNSTVETHYHGTFIDGTVFDSSIERDEPATFGVTQVISGWTEALMMMPVGSKWRIALPSTLAYGDAGAPPSIPGGAALVFDIHLLSIV